MSFNKLLLVLVAFAAFTSCKTPTDVIYFQDSKDREEVAIKNSFTPVFKVDDVVSITVSAADMDAARPFNLMQGSSVNALSEGGATGGSGISSEPTYLIDENGEIEFPVLGKLKIGGLTRVEVKTLIKDKLKVYINDPIVTVRLKNFKITVLGEVNRPGSFTIPNERITIIEALGLAGDMTITGKRADVVVIRENDATNTYYKVDLTSKNVFDSPVYYLAQNDVLYVEPNDTKAKASKGNRNTFSIVLSSISVILSALTLILR